MTEVNRRREADVVCVLLERQSKHANALFLEYPERVGHFLHEPLHLVGVDALNFSQQPEVVTELFGDLDERVQVFGETTAAKAQPRIEKSAPDARVHADAAGNLLDVGAGGLADHGNRVDVGNL